ncbi:ABC transporter permease [Agreia pratensis]|uniref:ABC transporter permease n=1 Tax=Microbacteriaceae TaxID=85023 RepID=UPI00188A842F|nr:MULTISPECIES: ABC transporter permease [Microbacteriaceae]MBF4561227.1 ABC transporter permease [Microbacterium sp. VKM Ac-2870]MBF4633884.1 ABC transporter permease [Agreia pratensis]
MAVLTASAAAAGLIIVQIIPAGHELTAPGNVQATLILGSPILLAGLGALWAERSGIVNIGLEGMMTLGTWGAAFGALMSGSPIVGLLFGFVLGALGGLLHAVMTVTFEIDHIVSGVAINLLAPGLVKFLSSITFATMSGGGATQSPPVPLLPLIQLPISDVFGGLAESGWPVLAPLADLLIGAFGEISSGVLLTAAVFVLTVTVLWRTPFGLRLRFSGESPAAALAVGLRVRALRYGAVIVSGGLAGLGGAILVLVSTGLYRDGQTAGRGYLGLAAMVFGNWLPGGTAIGSYLFGFTDALQLRGGGEAIRALLFIVAIGLALLTIVRARKVGLVATAGLAVAAASLAAVGILLPAVPAQLAYVAPYVTVLVALVIASQRVRPPQAVGKHLGDLE